MIEAEGVEKGGLPVVNVHRILHRPAGLWLRRGDERMMIPSLGRGDFDKKGRFSRRGSG